MDTDYLQRTVGPVLSSGLASMLIKQPEDPVDFIGEYLLDYVNRAKIENRRQRIEEKANLMLQESFVLQKTTIADDLSEIKDTKDDLMIKGEEELAESLAKVENKPEAYSLVTKHLLDSLSCTEVYLGKKIVIGGEQNAIHFIASSDETTVDRMLLGSKVGEGEEDGEEEGVLFRLWKKTEPGVKGEPTVDEDGNEVEAEEPEPVAPSHILVKNVMRDPHVKFFGIPRLGGFFAASLSYDSWIHPNGVQPYTPPPASEESPTNDEGGEEGKVEEETQETKDEAKEDGGEPPHPFVMQKIPVEMALCLHTMGKLQNFSEAHIHTAETCAKYLAESLAELEMRLFKKEVEIRKKLEPAAEALSKCRAKGDADIQTALNAGDKNASDAQKTLLEAEATYLASKECVSVMGEYFSLFSELHVNPCPEVDTQCLLLALELTGTSRDTLLSVDGSLDWTSRVRHCLVDLVEAVEKYDPRSVKASEKVEENLEMLQGEGIDAIVQAPCIALQVWLKAVLALSRATEAARLEEEEKEAAAQQEDVNDKENGEAEE